MSEEKNPKENTLDESKNSDNVFSIRCILLEIIVTMTILLYNLV